MATHPTTSHREAGSPAAIFRAQQQRGHTMLTSGNLLWASFVGRHSWAQGSRTRRHVLWPPALTAGEGHGVPLMVTQRGGCRPSLGAQVAGALLCDVGGCMGKFWSHIPGILEHTERCQAPGWLFLGGRLQCEALLRVSVSPFLSLRKEINELEKMKILGHQKSP